MLSETMSRGNSLVSMVKKEKEFEEDISEKEDYLEKCSEEKTFSNYIQDKKVLRQDVDNEEFQDTAASEEDNENEDLEENRMERMEMENYSLRKRCKRLENIVSQLLENKGKEEDEDDIESLENIRNQVEIDTCQENCSTNTTLPNFTSSYSTTTTRDKRKSIQEMPLFERRLASNEQPSNIKPLFISVSDFSAESLATPSKPTRSPKRSYLSHRPVSHIHIPSTLRQETHDDQSSHSLPPLLPSTPESPPALGDCSPEARDDRQSPTKKSKTNKDDDNISPEEMEQRNEVFRSTYYLAQSTTSRSGSTTKSTTVAADVYDEGRRLSRSPPYHFPESSSTVYLSSRYKSDPKSPPADSNSLYKSYYNRFYKHNSELDHKRQRYDIHHSRHEDRQHHHLNHDFHSDRSHHLPSTHYPPKMRPREQHPDRQLPNSGHSLHSPKDIINTQRVTSPIHLQSHHISHLNTRRGQTRNRPYPTNPVRRSMHRLVSVEQDLGKYNSDFYTKLPPKLHIVESQNDTGVTLTWNSTSNCDSSLVKSYQLFARELFGHKIGTMKRIGVVDALPLPMSCNIDKLKYHIKYKFAVCAIDIYGRYGKMSNFTGKFELKPKGPYPKLPPPPLEIADHGEESQLEIIM